MDMTTHASVFTLDTVRNPYASSASSTNTRSLRRCNTAHPSAWPADPMLALFWGWTGRNACAQKNRVRQRARKPMGGSDVSKVAHFSIFPLCVRAVLVDHLPVVECVTLVGGVLTGERHDRLRRCRRQMIAQLSMSVLWLAAPTLTMSSERCLPGCGQQTRHRPCTGPLCPLRLCVPPSLNL